MNTRTSHRCIVKRNHQILRLFFYNFFAIIIYKRCDLFELRNLFYVQIHIEQKEIHRIFRQASYREIFKVLTTFYLIYRCVYKLLL